MRLLTMKPLRVSGLSGARRWGYRTAGLVTAALIGGSLVTVVPASPALARTPDPAPGVTMGAAAPLASSVFLAYTGTDGAVYLRNEINGSVIGLGGRLIGGPAVTQAGTGLAVFGRGTDNALWWIHQVAGGTWSSWQSLGGVITSQPGAAAGVTAGFGPVVTLARGTDGALWYRVQGTGGGWSGWRSLSGRLLPGTGPAAVTTVGGDLTVAVTGTDHHIWLFSPTKMQVYGWLDFGGRTSSTPGIANDSPRREIQVQFIVFARGTDNALWSNYSGLAIGTPGGWTSLGGRLTSGPAAATVPTGATYAFVLGTDNLPWMRSGIWPSLGPWTRA
jgi:hypothetical protein